MNKNIWLFSLTSFLTDASSEIIFPVLPLLLTILGASTLDIGLIEGLSEFLSNFLRIFSGDLADKLKAKPLIIGGYLTSAISKSLYISSIVLNTWFFVLLGRSLDRVGKAIRSPGRDAILSLSVQKEKTGLAFGIHRTADTLGALVGSLFVLWFFYKFGSTESSIKHLIMLALIPAFLAILPLFFVFEPQRDLKLTKKEDAISKDFYIFSFVIFLCLSTNFSYAFYILIGKAKHLSFLDISFGYVLFNLIYTLFGIPVGKLYDSVKNKHALFSITLLILSLAQFSASLNFYIGFLIFGLFNAFYDVIGRSLVSLYGIKKRSKAYGIYGFSVANATLFANVLLGILSHFINLYLAFKIESALSALLAMAWYVYSNRLFTIKS
ncbi:MFS transporter [Hydrogenobaculum acidophilum]